MQSGFLLVAVGAIMEVSAWIISSDPSASFWLLFGITIPAAACLGLGAYRMMLPR
jgi:hypothetical protein